MLNKQDIINLALVKVGNKPKTEVTDEYIDITYKAGKQYLLGKHYWRFAKIITPLSINANLVIPDWSYVYRLPNNVGCILDVTPHATYDIFGANLVCASNPISLIYSATDIDDSLPSEFGLLLATWMAKEIITIVKGDTSSVLYNILNSQYQEMLLDATATDSASISSLTLHSNRYIDVR